MLYCKWIIIWHSDILFHWSCQEEEGQGCMLGGGTVEPYSSGQKWSSIALPPAFWNQPVVKCAPGCSFSVFILLWWYWPSWPAYRLCSDSAPQETTEEERMLDNRLIKQPQLPASHIQNSWVFTEWRACSGLFCIAFQCYQSSLLIR